MKKIFEKLMNIKTQIEDKKSELTEIDSLPYYQTFGKGQKERDRQQIKIELKQLLATKDSLLDSLSQEINLEKIDTSYYQRTLQTQN